MTSQPSQDCVLHLKAGYFRENYLRNKTQFIHVCLIIKNIVIQRLYDLVCLSVNLLLNVSVTILGQLGASTGDQDVFNWLWCFWSLLM